MIRLSPKHGVNPAIPKCFYCLKDKGEVILAGLLKDDQEAPHGMVWNKEPCTKCGEYMEMGVILISVSEEKTKDRQNPYRTGGFVVIKEDALDRMGLASEQLEEVRKSRVMFVPGEVWRAWGLPGLPGAEE